jgi:hypothetical protein
MGKMRKTKSFLMSTAAALLGLAALAAPVSAQDITVIWADDSTSDVTFDPRVTQSRHEEQIIVQVFEFTWAPDWGRVLGTLGAGLAVTLVLSLAGALPILSARPASALRSV